MCIRDRYKLISKGLFACNPMHVGRDERLPIALYEKDNACLLYTSTKWDLHPENDSCEYFTQEQQMQIDLDNPLCLDFIPRLELNGKTMLTLSLIHISFFIVSMPIIF